MSEPTRFGLFPVPVHVEVAGQPRAATDYATVQILAGDPEDAGRVLVRVIEGAGHWRPGEERSVPWAQILTRSDAEALYMRRSSV
jgi:hypothetical protein